MLSRRFLLAASPLAAALSAVSRPALAQAQGGQAGDFGAFLATVRVDARRAGISDAVIAQAFAGIHPNRKVIELDQRQPEFTQTWAQYRDSRLSDARITAGRSVYAQNQPLLAAITRRFGPSAAVVMGVWGIETNFGGYTGGFNVIEALATLAWEGRRAAYFRKELIAALHILQDGDISPRRMTGSYAGAMGQPQFMPSSFATYAVDFEGNGRRDIWDSRPDALASIANYLAKSGWRAGEPWGQPVLAPPSIDPNLAGRDNRQTLGAWMQLGVRRIDGTPFSRDDVPGSLLLPDGPGGDAFLVYANFAAIRRYNPSDFYALAVGLLGETVVA